MADELADAEHRAHVDVPDLGPAVVMDQLTVLVHDATVGGADESPATVSTRLRGLRLTLA